MFKLIELLNSTNTGCIRRLCCFIFKLLNYEPNCYIEADNDIQYNLLPLTYIYSIFVCSGKFGGQLLS